MQCNQPFYGNGFTNGQFYNCCNNTPLQCSQNMYSEIVGEGEVTSMTLPDGTVQFFFMPTMKWWAPNTSQCYPNVANPTFANTNFNSPHCNNNVGTWFVRSISNPFPNNAFSVPPQRYEVPRINYNSDYNMNTSSNGYQLKFHNDNWTSTTDLHYFCPSLRQRDYMVKQPCKATAAAQVETVPVANKTCHYEFVCSKPCKCSTADTKPMSVVSLVEPKQSKKINIDSTDSSSDEAFKNHRRDKKKKSQKQHNIVCGCASKARIVTAEKSITTYMDEGSSCTPAGGRETQTIDKTMQKCQSCCKEMESTNLCVQPAPVLKIDDVLQKCEVKRAETWKPVTPLSKKGILNKSSENITEDSDNEYNGGPISSNCSCYSE